MKKFVSLFLTLMLCISMMLIVTSCGTKHPIEEFKNKMADADSYQMSFTMSNIPLFGTITITTKVDGNIQYTPAIMFNEEEYIVHSDLTLIRTKDSYLYSLNVNYGILNGEFNNFSLEDKNYSIILPAYLNSLNGENTYVDIIAPNLQKAQGMYTKYQEYVIDGTMYWCVAIDNTHNVLLLNEQITYEDWRENK